MNGEVLVLAEHSGQELSSITLELLGKGRDLADSMGYRLGVVILGSQLRDAIDCLSGKVDRLYYVDHPDLGNYNAEIFGNVLVSAVKNIDPGLLLLGYTFFGMELGPALATQLGVPLASNCLVVECSDVGKIRVERPLCGEMFRVRQEHDLPLMVSAPLTVFSGKGIRACQTGLVCLEYPTTGRSVRTKVREVVRQIAGRAGITRAEFLVAVGRGVGSPDRVRIFQELAQALGGALACSRPVVDMGWLPADHLVGLSGSTVKPRVYIACGISGAAQHVVGMSGSSTIIAINRDPQAPIFNVANHGIVGDMFEVVPEIAREWSRRQCVHGRT